jgi:hypothetical protein
MDSFDQYIYVGDITKFGTGLVQVSNVLYTVQIMGSILRNVIFLCCVLTARVAAQVKYAPMTPPQGQPIVDFPIMGFGTAAIATAQAKSVVASAMAKGFRSFDTAMVYGNEVGVGQGIAKGLKENGLKREDIWVTTKVSGSISIIRNNC